MEVREIIRIRNRAFKLKKRASVVESKNAPVPNSSDGLQKSESKAGEKTLDNNAPDPNKQPTTCTRWGWNGIPRPWHAVVTAKLAPNTTDVLNGFVLGGAYRLSKHFAIMVGIALSPSDGPSPGFTKAAAQIVKSNPTNPVYQNFDPASMLAGKANAFDGFPLFVQDATGSATTAKVFQGDPLVTHYHPGLFIGVTFPISQLTGVKNPN